MKRSENLLSLLGVILFVATLAFGFCRTAAGQTEDEVKSLIDQLDTQDGAQALAARQAAEKQLEDYIKMNRLTPALLGTLRTYPVGPPLELLRRKEKILATWTTRFPAVSNVIDSVKFETTEYFFRDWFFQFDGFFGGANVGEPDVVELERRYEAIRNALLAADTPRVVAALEALRNWVGDEQRFPNFSLKRDKDRRVNATRLEVIAKIDQAINEAQNAIRAINIGSNNVMPPPRQPIPMQRQGAIDTGRTLRLALSADPITPGGLDVFMPTYDLALAQPPAGYQFVGEIFDLLATDGLEVTGMVSVGIEYGQTQLFGNPVVDPSMLRMARLANGRAEILPDFINDTSNFVITAFYTPESASSGRDQFGEFAIIQVPEPSTLIPLGTGILCFGYHACWRRKQDRMGLAPLNRFAC